MTRTTMIRTHDVGKPVTSYDATDKVTGGARYAADFAAPDMVHAVVVSADIAVGRINGLDTAATERL